MITDEMKVHSKEHLYISHYIENWYFKERDKVLNVIAAPYSSLRPFVELTSELCEQQKKVLYINSNGEACNEFITLMKDKYGTKKYSIIRNEFKVTDENFELVDCDEACRTQERYDLVIYDDLSSYSSMSKIEIRNYLYYIYKRTKKLMIYSIEPIFDNIKTFKIPDLDSKNPFVEPRFLTTRVDLNADIPYLLYDYIRWFKRNNRKVVIYTPNDEMTQLVYDYFVEKLKVSNRIKIIKIQNEKKIISSKKVIQIKDKPVMIITNLDIDHFSDIENKDAIIYFADDKKFNYKNIIYTCGRVSKGGEKSGEVLLVSNEISAQMEMAKDMARSFNKLAWDRGLLK